MVLDLLRKERSQQGFTYQEMANKVGISKEYYWMIENGKRRLNNYELAVKIAAVFGKSPDSLFLNKDLTTSELNNQKECIS